MVYQSIYLLAEKEELGTGKNLKTTEEKGQGP